MSDINERAQVDPSQVDDRRGAGGRFGGLRGGRIPIPTTKTGLIVTLILLLITVFGGGAGYNALQDDGSGTEQASDCSINNPDRYQQTDCRAQVYVVSIQDFWQEETPRAFGTEYQMTQTVLFDGSTDTGCGLADSGVGPFFCPVDDLIYIDLGFYELLASRFGAPGAFAQAYVMAHEYGHYLQDLLGTAETVRAAQQRDPDLANEYSVMLELQADCYSGVWASHAESTTDRSGTPIFESISQQDIQDAVTAAGAVGDDAIQRKMGGPVDESAFTHGSSADRERWFTTGFQSGDPNACDTFGGAL